MFSSGYSVEFAVQQMNVDPVKAWTMWFIQNPLEFAEMKTSLYVYPEDTWSNKAIAEVLKNRYIPKCVLDHMDESYRQESRFYYSFKQSDVVLALTTDSRSSYTKKLEYLAHKMKKPFLQFDLRTDPLDIAVKVLDIAPAKDRLHIYITGSLIYELEGKKTPLEVAKISVPILNNLSMHKEIIVRSGGALGMESGAVSAAYNHNIQSIVIMDQHYATRVTEVRYPLTTYYTQIRRLTTWPKR